MMQKIYHGIDMVECSRMEQLAQRHKQRFFDRVFTKAELAYCNKYQKSYEHLAGRFAVKEAVMKILGTGWSDGISWQDIETRNTATGKPEVFLYNKASQIANQMGIGEIAISITHTGDLAMASAVAIKQTHRQMEQM